MKYDTGAVRDDREGKGRFDLISKKVFNIVCDDLIGQYETTEQLLYTRVLKDFVNEHYLDSLFKVFRLVDMLANKEDTGFACKVKVNVEVINQQFDFNIGAVGLILLANRLEEGAKHYGERNWEKGIPIDRYIDSGLRHLIKTLVCNNEDHWGAFIWNLHCIIHELEKVNNNGR